ncbi:hypothetical protein LXA43DRAFT_1023794 [Ganoderma leucocontextum]|nr:hypothetical protein LXA43DRAFT_1023794 [Ganoderma leucocontextum]
MASVVLSRIKEALACGLVGVVVGACVYGITVLQAYIYFQNSRQDSVYTRSFVAFLFILDTLSLVFAADTLYQSVVTDFGDPLLLINMPLTFALENAATVLIGTLTQCFLAHRLWQLSRHNVALVSSILPRSSLRCVLSVPGWCCL